MFFSLHRPLHEISQRQTQTTGLFPESDRSASQLVNTQKQLIFVMSFIKVHQMKVFILVFTFNFASAGTKLNCNHLESRQAVWLKFRKGSPVLASENLCPWCHVLGSSGCERHYFCRTFIRGSIPLQVGLARILVSAKGRFGWFLPATSLFASLCGSPGITSVVTVGLRFVSGNALGFVST